VSQSEDFSLTNNIPAVIQETPEIKRPPIHEFKPTHTPSKPRQLMITT
jgi:hypothetical protein